MIAALLLILLLQPLPPLPPGVPPGPDASILGPQTMTGAEVSAALAGSPLASEATLIYDQAVAANINVAFALAVWVKESQYGTAGAARDTRNVGNLICAAANHPPATGCSGRWAVYPSYEMMARDWFRYINAVYVAQRPPRTTVRAVIYKYAPPSENNTEQYIEQTLDRMRTPAQHNGATQGGGATGGGLVDDWIYRPIDSAIYTLLRLLTGSSWALDRAMLNLIDMMERLRLWLVSSGFRSIIDLLSENFQVLSSAVFRVGFALGLVFLILRTISKIELISLRRLLLLMVATPILLPFAGIIFQDLETTRANMASAMYETVFVEVAPHMDAVIAQEVGADIDEQMGPATPFNPATGVARHGVDVAAAYVYAVYADVKTPNSPPPSDLPDAFETIYFTLTPQQMQSATAAQRQEAIFTAGRGLIRMGWGLLIAVFAVFESATQLMFTLGMGFLGCALVGTIIFSFLRPMEHITAALGRQVLNAYVASWGISVLQAILLALVFAAAGSQNAITVLSVSLFGVILAGVFLWSAFKLLLGATFSSFNLMTGNMATPAMVSASGAALAHGAQGAYGAGQEAWTGATRRLPQAVAGSGAVRGAAGGLAAARAGNPRGYAMTYGAALASPGFATVAGLATAMRRSEPGARSQALATAERSRHGVTSQRTQTMLRADGRTAARIKAEADQHAKEQTP